MKENIKLSLIVSIYGVEEYIGKFLDSLENNLLPGIEVILVDDGTKDKSGVIADEFASQHADFLTVIHKKNGGISSARNAGLRIASGEYVIFPDPDDWLDRNYCRCILEAIEKYNHPDMILFDYTICEPSRTRLISIHFLNKDGHINKEKYFSEFVANDSIKDMLWFRAIKRKFFENICFREDVRFAEDALILTDIVIDMSTFVYIKKNLYYYRVREGSLVKIATIEDYHKAFLMGLDRVDKYKNALNKVSLNMPVKFCWRLLRLSYIENKEIDTKRYEKYICDNLMKILFDEHMHFTLKKHCFLIYLGVARKYIKWKYRID